MARVVPRGKLRSFLNGCLSKGLDSPDLVGLHGSHYSWRESLALDSILGVIEALLPRSLNPIPTQDTALAPKKKAPSNSTAKCLLHNAYSWLWSWS